MTGSATMYNSPFSALGQVPEVVNTTKDPAFHGIPAQVGSQLQSYTDDSQLNAGAAGFPWALDANPIVSCVPEQFGCGPLRSLVGVGGNVYKIQAIGSASASNATYKAQPMLH